MTLIVCKANDPICDLFFRRCYKSGMDAVISGLINKPSRKEVVKIEEWIANELVPWSSSKETVVALPRNFRW